MDAAIFVKDNASRSMTLDFESISSTGCSRAIVAVLFMCFPFRSSELQPSPLCDLCRNFALFCELRQYQFVIICPFMLKTTKQKALC